jgi:nitrite reductase/ring-hydroxylating ferredoxin subunit
VPVNIYISAGSPEFHDISVVGGWTYITAGSRGIVLYRYSSSEFKAYDRHCPYQPENTCGIVSVQTNQLTLKDDCCGSEFLLQDGSVINGPAVTGLKIYQTDFDGQTLHIYN